MTIEDALFIIDSVLPHKRLNNIQEQLLRHAWDGKNYHEIAEICNYDASYIRDVGYRLWRLLSEAFGERVTKHNFQVVIKKNRHRALFPAHQDSQGGQIPRMISSNPLSHDTIAHPSLVQAGLSNVNGEHQSRNSQNYSPIYNLNASLNAQGFPQPIGAPMLRGNTCCDWGDAMEPTIFYGRTAELAAAKRWLLDEGCRLMGILGMGGIGKTAFAIKLAEEIQGEFDYVIWRSLRNAPPALEFLADVVTFLSGQTNKQALLDKDFATLLQIFSQCLRQSRCLLIWDNFESVLQGGEMTGQYTNGLAEYGEILRQVGETRHQSALILTTREKPKEIMPPDHTYGTLTQSLQLSGLGEESAAIFPPSLASNSATQDLINYYGGNPLALTVVSRSIMSLYDGDMTDFCAHGVGVFSDVRDLLSQQYDRLSDLEQQLMYWLAIEREPIPTNDLRANLVPPVSKAHVLEALCSLRWRSLIEKGSAGFTQQPIVMEYMTEQLIEQVSNSLINGDLSLIMTYALVKRQAEPYIRQMQIKQIVRPIAQRLWNHFGHCRNEQECFGEEYPPNNLGHNLQNHVQNYLQMLQERISQQYGSFGYGYYNLTILLQQVCAEADVPSQLPNNLRLDSPIDLPIDVKENSSHTIQDYIHDYGDILDDYALQSINSECQPMTKGIKNGLRFELVSDIAHA